MQTDALIAELSNGLLPDGIGVSDLRFVLRISALFHDVGKLLDVYTPGCHTGLGKKLWAKYVRVTRLSSLLVNLQSEARLGLFQDREACWVVD